MQEAAAPDALELALAQALIAATRAGKWHVVVQLAAELQERRQARQALDAVPLTAACNCRRGER